MSDDLAAKTRKLGSDKMGNAEHDAEQGPDHFVQGRRDILRWVEIKAEENTHISRTSISTMNAETKPLHFMRSRSR